MFAIWDFLTNILQTFGLFRKNAEIAFLGLDNAGKTTLLRMLVDSRQSQTPPTLHPIKEEINIGNVKFITTDIGGHYQARDFWPNYYFSKNAIVFVLDAADTERFFEAKNELSKILAEPLIANLPVAIIANKIDKPNAANEYQIQQFFELTNLRTGKDVKSYRNKNNNNNNNVDINNNNNNNINGVNQSSETNRPLELFMCSIKDLKGHTEPFKWLAELLN